MPDKTALVLGEALAKSANQFCREMKTAWTPCRKCTCCAERKGTGKLKKNQRKAKEKLKESYRKATEKLKESYRKAKGEFKES